VLWLLTLLDIAGLSGGSFQHISGNFALYCHYTTCETLMISKNELIINVTAKLICLLIVFICTGILFQ
jgi:hypothetical protein